MICTKLLFLSFSIQSQPTILLNELETIPAIYLLILVASYEFIKLN